MSNTKNIYRVDKFKVPEAAQTEFLARVKDINAMLGKLPGFVEARVLKQTGGPGKFNFVTIAVWENAEAIAAAKDVAAAHYRATGFNPQEMFARLNIEADIASYVAV